MSLTSVAFIPDGNRRYAKEKGISLAEAYLLGTKKAWKVIEYLKEYPNIKQGIFYTLSYENIKKRNAELGILFKIFSRELDKALERRFFEKNNIKVNFIGRIDLLPKYLQEKIKATEDSTANFNDKTINLAIGYDGQEEIIAAVKRIADDYKKDLINISKLNIKRFISYLYLPIRNIDLIIRTSGTERLSGFLTYQSAYSELYFCEKYWPEFDKDDLAEAIAEFYRRERRFGR